jgi:hypothetical protein
MGKVFGAQGFNIPPHHHGQGDTNGAQMVAALTQSGYVCVGWLHGHAGAKSA